MQAIGGLIDDIIVLGIFIYLSLLVSGKIKLRQERQEKFDAMMERKGTLFKILAYGGTIIFAALILIGIFSFKDKSQNTFNVNTQPRQWTQVDKDAMTKACIENAKNSYAKDPVKTTSLCECVTEKFTAKYTYDQAQELGKKS
jgi:amino acid transporter